MNYIIDPVSLEKHSIFSSYGKNLLKQYIQYVQTGGKWSKKVMQVICDRFERYLKTVLEGGVGQDLSDWENTYPRVFDVKKLEAKNKGITLDINKPEFDEIMRSVKKLSDMTRDEIRRLRFFLRDNLKLYANDKLLAAAQAQAQAGPAEAEAEADEDAQRRQREARQREARQREAAEAQRQRRAAEEAQRQRAAEAQRAAEEAQRRASASEANPQASPAYNRNQYGREADESAYSNAGKGQTENPWGPASASEANPQASPAYNRNPYGQKADWSAYSGAGTGQTENPWGPASASEANPQRSDAGGSAYPDLNTDEASFDTRSQGGRKPSNVNSEAKEACDQTINQYYEIKKLKQFEYSGLKHQYKPLTRDEYEEYEREIKELIRLWTKCKIIYTGTDKRAATAATINKLIRLFKTIKPETISAPESMVGEQESTLESDEIRNHLIESLFMETDPSENYLRKIASLAAGPQPNPNNLSEEEIRDFMEYLDGRITSSTVNYNPRNSGSYFKGWNTSIYEGLDHADKKLARARYRLSVIEAFMKGFGGFGGLPRT